MSIVAFDDSAMSRTHVQLWYNWFKEGREYVDDDACPGRPRMSTTDEHIEAVKKMILDNYRITIREVANDVGIQFVSCQAIFMHVLRIKRAARFTKIVLKLINLKQKPRMLPTFKADSDLLKKIITGDKSWLYGYDIETKAQSFKQKRPEEPRAKKARQARSNAMVLLTVFFNCNDLVHHEFLPQGRSINKEYYLEVKRQLREAIRQKRTVL